MGKVIRVVRLPDRDETMAFELSLPRGADIFKVAGVFAGVVDNEGQPIPCDGLFLLVDANEPEIEIRRFQVACLTSGLDDLTSEVPVLPGSIYRFISDIQGGFMLFESLDLQTAVPATIGDIPVIHI